MLRRTSNIYIMTDKDGAGPNPVPPDLVAAFRIMFILDFNTRPPPERNTKP
jgi:hypothetical protein